MYLYELSWNALNNSVSIRFLSRQMGQMRILEETRIVLSNVEYYRMFSLHSDKTNLFLSQTADKCRWGPCHASIESNFCSKDEFVSEEKKCSLLKKQEKCCKQEHVN
uniref:Ovule protein n=1 Tax=Caenorhabditis tropicalis TaxID=1561998 RepID=A0A1I7T9C7_9PELO